MSALDAASAWLAWALLLAPGYGLYYVNRTKRLTENILLSLVLLIPASVTLLENYNVHLANPIPPVAAVAIFYLSHAMENVEGRKPPAAVPMLLLMWGFSLAITLAFAGVFSQGE